LIEDGRVRSSPSHSTYRSDAGSCRQGLTLFNTFLSLT